MQRGIDSFFKRVTPAVKKCVDLTDSPVQPVKRKARVISSDEDEVPESPQVSKAHKKTRTNESSSSKKSSASKKSSSSSVAKSPTPKKELKRVDPTTLFGGETMRVEAKKLPKPKELAVIELEDDDIDKSLMEIDMDESILDTKVLTSKTNGDKSNTESKQSPRKNNNNTESSKQEDKYSYEHAKELEKKTEKGKLAQDNIKNEKLSPPSAKKLKPNEEKVRYEDQEKSTQKNTPKSVKKPAKSTPKVKKESQDLESSILTDEDRQERRRMTAMLYQQYKNRSAVLNPGSKEVPKGKPNCLAGLTFVVTGVLESLERDEAGSIIKEYGGKVVSTVGKRLNYLIVGEEAGPKKLVQAEEFGTTILSEDGFFDLIREKSGDKLKAKSDVDVDANKAKVATEKPTTSPKVKKQESKEAVKVKKEKQDNTTPENKTKKVTHRSEEKSIKKENTAEELNNNNNGATKIKQEKLVTQQEQPFKIEKEKSAVSDNMLAWVDKYKPTNVKEIIGQQGAASNVHKLQNWLSKWYINNDGKKKLQKPNPWAKNDDGSSYKAALLSGPPGIGKTTTATLVCKELGFDAVEMNASDTRSKRLLKEEVSELLTNKSLYGYFHGNAQAVSKKHVLIMDEVDGMAGNEDRGGMQELIGLIKESSVPIICMCNDRNHQKMRSLVNYCYDLRFNKPRLEQIKGAIMSICFKEKIKMEPAKVEQIIAATNNDIRQTINHISLMSAGKDLNLKSDKVQSGEKTAEKDLKIGPWEVVRKVFSADEHKNMNINDKCDLFFHDYSMAPLFVQQNYLQVLPVGPKNEVLQKVALTADALSLGDLVDKRIRSNMAWSLLPTQAVFSSVMPGAYMSGRFTGQINFPGWLGKYSRSNKRSRLAQEIHDHTRLRTSGSRLSVRMDYAPFLLANIVRPLKEHGMDGVEQALAVMKEYHLLREDLDSLIDLTTWPGKKGPMDAVDGRVKAALTRAYNKEVLAYSYSATAGVKKKKAEAADEGSELLGMEGEECDNAVADSDDEKDDALENDGLIKAKKATATNSKAKSSSSTSKKPTKAKATTSAKAKK